MNIGTISMIILFSISAFLWIAGYTSALGSIISADKDTGEVGILESSLYQQIVLILGMSVVGALAGYFTGGNSIQYSLFIGLGTFIISFIALPISIISEAGMPFEIKLIVGGVFSLTFMISIINWIKGNEL